MIKKKRQKLTLEAKILFLSIILAVLLALSVFMYIKFANQEKTVEDSISYNVSESVVPVVCLTSNEFLDSDCSTEDKSYVTSLIDKIKINLKYNLSASNLANYNYKYKATLTVIANEKGDSSKVVYNKQEVLEDTTELKEQVGGLNFNKSYDIDFQKYNNLISNFKKSYVLALDSKIVIQIDQDVTGIYGPADDSESKHHSYTINIPLGEQTVNIERTNLTYENADSIVKYSDIRVYSLGSLIADILYKGDILAIIIIVIAIIKLIPQQKEYTKKIKKILKEYDRAIVITKNLPDLKELNIIEITSFEELLDVKDNLDKPILFWQSKHQDRAKFIVLNYKEAYLYTINAFDIDNK